MKCSWNMSLATRIPSVLQSLARTANLRVLPVGRKEIEKLVQRFVDEIRAKKERD